MKHSTTYTAALATVAFLLLPNCASAQVTAPSFYATGIQVQGEAEGTEFDDWAGVPVAVSDPEDNPGEFEGRPFIDFASLQVANDNEFLYLHMTYHNTSSFNTFIGIDVDTDLATGFDLFQLGLIGSDVGYQNDYPFQQFTGVYNLNVSLTGGPLSNGGALIYTFWDQDGMDKEWAIPLDLGLGFATGDPASTVAFRDDTIDILFYTEEGAGDIHDVVRYTFATAPTLEGDYNGDGTVDAADYTVWRDSLNDIGQDLPADGSGNMVVDQADYIVWRDNYGATAGLSAAAPAPEPASALLVLLIAAGAGAMRGRGAN
ncbi:MAG: hypothetical protein KDA37_09370 [Planctomycetales bacterium]|nr:hypothetical protein [Planctomycetales bacterium]